MKKKVELEGIFVDTKGDWLRGTSSTTWKRIEAKKSFAQLKRDQRAAKRRAGYVLKQIWTLPKHWPRIKAAIARIHRS